MNSFDAPRIARLDHLAEGGGFRADPRYGALPARPDPREQDRADWQLAASDAHARGYEEGRAAALAEAEARMAAEDAARTKLGNALVRIGTEDARRLSERLRDIALAVCCEMLAPLTLDEDALNRRISACLDLLRDAGDRVLHLNPDDIALLDGDLCKDLTIAPDATLPRGEIRIETPDGGVEDGPATWRAAIAEALQTC